MAQPCLIIRTRNGAALDGQGNQHFERDGITWTIFGALDGAIHFLDADTGNQLLKPLQTDDIIKGSVTVDPDGFPIVYTGGRDDLLRLVAIDRGEPLVLWSLDSDTVEGSIWNNDRDGAPLLINDYLFIGGENSVFHIIKLNRSYDEDGFVMAEPELVFAVPGYDDDLINTVGSNALSRVPLPSVEILHISQILRPCPRMGLVIAFSR